MLKRFRKVFVATIAVLALSELAITREVNHVPHHSLVKHRVLGLVWYEILDVITDVKTRWHNPSQ